MSLSKPLNASNTGTGHYSIVGIPDHEGIIRVGGRIGAALGPEAFRRAYSRLKGPRDLTGALICSLDVTGLSTDIELNHEQAALAIEGVRKLAQTVVVVGGGHDYGHSHLLGIKRSITGSARIGCINLDAHLDLRTTEPTITSGSPFFMAIERGVIQGCDLIEFGIQDHCNAPALWDYAKAKQVEIVPMKELRPGHTLSAVALFSQCLERLAKDCDEVVISLDLDCAPQSAAPGVSAPQPEGIAVSDLMAMVELAGAHPKVNSLGLFELCPVHDIQDQTAKLAATLAYHFVDAALPKT